MATRFGAYEILHELKTGGMGAVLLGRRRGPGAFEQLVALKTIRPEYAGAPAVRAMFLDEAAILARLNHPGIATVHDFGEEGGTLYMAMEYVAGISFRALAERGSLPPLIAARAIAEACRGLHAAHEVRDPAGTLLGVVHRDISPDNLLLGFDGHVKVIDFGIALVKNRQAPVTELGTVKGKPPYMSPEQVKNDAMDRRSDVFSLAVVLHELLTGESLFRGDSIYAIAIAVEQQAIEPPSQRLGAPLPLGLDAAVMAALSRDVDQRTPTAAAFAEALEQVIGAAGDETLEAWAERELAGAREKHRAWLASVVAGTQAMRPVGRATGEVTAVRPEPAAAQVPAAQVPAVVDDEGAAAPARRSRGLRLALAGLLLAGGIGGGLFWLHDRGGPAREPAGHLADAAIVAVAAEPADAAAVTDAAAPPPADAATTARINPPRKRPDAPPPPPPSPPSPPSPAGMGTISIRARGESFLNIVLDGKPFAVTPQLDKPIAAGPHTIELLDPKSGEVVYSTRVTVEPGEHERVRPPAK